MENMKSASLITVTISVIVGIVRVRSNSIENEILPVIPVNLQDVFTEEVGAYEAPSHIKEKYPYYMSGFDDENHPIWMVEFGSWDLRSIIEGGGEDLADFERYVDAIIYRVLNSTTILSTDEDPVRHYVLLVDMDHYDMRQLKSLPTVTFILKRFREYLNVAQNLHVAFCINVNFVAQVMVNMVRPILGPHMEKVNFFGTNRAKWLPRILSQLPPDQLPIWYGGTQDTNAIQIYG